MRKFDYIVVGSGLAGLYAAWKASLKGSVAVITKSLIRESNSFNAQGGIAAVTSFDDNPEIHKSDTLIAGRGLCEEHSVDILVNEGPDRIDEIIAEGEAEYMRILSDAYNNPDKADFYSFVRQLDAMKATLANGDDTIVLDKDSPIAELFYD